MDDDESETTEDNLINMDVSRYECVAALFFYLAILHPNTRTLSLFQKQESPNLYLSLPMKHYSLKKAYTTHSFLNSPHTAVYSTTQTSSILKRTVYRFLRTNIVGSSSANFTEKVRETVSPAIHEVEIRFRRFK